MRESKVHSAVRLLGIALASVFVAEVLVMLILPHFALGASAPARAMIDASILVVVLLPILHAFLYRPLALQIGELEKARKESAASQEQTEAILDSLDAFVYVADMETYELLFVNKTGRNTFGNVEGRTCWETLQSGQSGPCDFCTNAKLFDAEGNPTGGCAWEFRNTVTDRWYDIRDRAIRWMDGRLVRLEIATDITDRKLAEQKVKESEERFRVISEATFEGIGITDAGKVVDVNPQMAAMLGYAREEMVGRAVADFVAPEAREEVGRKMEEGQAEVYEHKAVRKDGSEIDVEVRGRRMEYRGRPVRVTAIRDVTERKRFERELARWEDIFRHAEFGVVVSSPDGKHLGMMNQAFARMHGYTVEELTGRPIADVFTPEERAKVPAYARRAEEEGHHDFESVHLRKDGSRFPVLTSLTAIRGGDGSVLSRVASVKDITELKAVEQKVRESERRYRNLFASMRDVIIVADAERNIVDANQPAMRNVFGYELADILGKKTEVLYASEEEFRSTGRAVFDRGEGAAGKLLEAAFRRKNGETFPCELFALKLLDEEGAVLGNFGVIRDITDRKGAEEELKRSEERFRVIVENSQPIVFMVDVEGRFVLSEGEMLASLGLKPGQVVGQSAFELYREYPKIVAGLRVALAGRVHKDVIGVRGPAGPVHFDIFYSPYRDHRGDVVGVIGMAVDISERVLAEKAFEEHALFLQVLIDTIPNPVFFKDECGWYLGCNRAFEELIGVTRDEIVGKSVYDLAPRELAETYDAKDQELFDLRGIQIYESPVVDSGGKERAVVFYKATFEKLDGSLGGLVGVMLDITERKRAADQLERSLREKEVLLQEVHHRVKNNMQIIASLLKLQSRASGGTTGDEVFREAMNRIRSMALVHEELYRSADLADIHVRPYLLSIVRNVFTSYGAAEPRIRLLSDRLGDASINMDTAIPCGLIVNELVSNSLKHGFPGKRSGRVSIEFGEEEGRYRLAVSDNGVGLPEGMDFLHAKTLGLQLVVTLARQLNGEIELPSTGETTVAVRFSPLLYPERGA